MLILGIDPGSQILGYALLDIGEPARRQATVIEMDVLYLKRTSDFNLRIEQIFHSVKKIMESRQPDQMAIEAPFLGKNAQSMLKLGRAQGIAIAVAMAHNIPYHEYEPSLIKRTVTGNGNASKEQVCDMLRSILDIEERPHYLDASDALAVAYTHFALAHSTINTQKTLHPHPKKKKSAKKQWSDYIAQNPHLLQ